ncbi:MAG: ethanolamine ammonia-lyase [Betaproteobacteria bacterium HGW-Betaproteobacteria-7]|jgi:ethanolamine ammonia-lyase small subunit|nr:MAG: ethanolamine ammonia-lyase [Betaproteobacteria bacterium HGW-Betaproteobacteria-7]
MGEQLPLVADDPWSVLRCHTTARIGLGRTGASQPTRHHLAFQLDQARARDAVLTPLDVTRLQAELTALGQPAVLLRSAAAERRTYLQRPDLGRRLGSESAARLASLAADGEPADVALIIADGLSAPAVQMHAVPLLQALLPQLPAAWRLAPLCLVEQGRVAISDEIGAVLRARLAVILIGERPGLSSPDSLGVYLTYGPRIGNTDAGRNCLSNIRAAGLSYAAAAHKLHYLIGQALARQLSGVALKDEAPEMVEVGRQEGTRTGCFLLGADEQPSG